MANASTQGQRQGISSIVSIAVLFLSIAAAMFLPGLVIPLGGLALVASLVISWLLLVVPRRAALAAAEEAGHATAMANACNEEVLDILKKSRDHQEELAGHVLDTIKLAAIASDKNIEMQGSVEAFQDDFLLGRKAVGSINELVQRFDGQVAQLALASQQSAAASEEMAASIERMSSESGARYEEIKDLASLSRDGQAEMRSSIDIIKRVVSSIDTLNSFISTINDIAGRTSLLAMNAAIQAAHAGEAGRGFAVVAGEVRKLAASSSDSAQAISGRLADLIASIKKAEATSQASAEIFATVEDRVQRATDSFLEIKNGTSELALAGREIRDAISSLNEVSAQIKGASGEASGEVRSLDSRFSHLESATHSIAETMEIVTSNFNDVNFNALTIAQSDVEQLRLSGAALVASGVPPLEASSLSTILKLQHRAWVARINAAIHGKVKVDASKAGDHASCELGVWLAGPAKKEVGDLPELAELATRHRAMHERAARIITDLSAGKSGSIDSENRKLGEDTDLVIDLIGKVFRQRRGGFMSWRREYEVGNGTIDAQHQRLVALINKLAEAMDSGLGRDALGGILAELINYTATHFKDEEAIFSATGYPDTRAHRGQHEDLVKQVLKLRDDFQSGASVLSAGTLAFLKDWLNGHILGTDQGYVKYLK
ncbi:MAG: bacteriohemerythrin [Rectinemataceae bacterium]